MKRLGFTLSEVIIALGIIGILAAITSPLTSGIMPDRSKILVLRAYKTLSNINEELVNDPGLYMSDGSCIGLACTQRPVKPPYNKDQYTGSNKYINLLKEKFNDSEWAGTTSIITKDGITWTVESRQSVIVDINSKGKNCSYDKTKCTNPDRFKFSIDDRGRVTANDPLTKAYLANPYKLNDRKNDLKTASGKDSTKKTDDK